jgi:putative endonuclease
MAGYLYILYSYSRDRFYIGATTNPRDRIVRHNAGYSKSTLSGRPWLLMYMETYETYSEAAKRESDLKRAKRRSTLEALAETWKSSPWPLPE